jgi:large subunit ribosomal protein L6
MSRIGKQLITIPEGVTVEIKDSLVTVNGKNGSLSVKVPFKIKVEVKDSQVFVTRLSEAKTVKACHGAIRAHINNAVQGVQELWKKELEIRGTGYKAALNGNKLTLNVGFIHTVDFTAPEGITFTLDGETKIAVTGVDKTLVGQVASNIRKVRKPEPYKGKGIRYLNEYIKLKPGKKVKA